MYRGSIESLQGAYIYADFVSTGKIWALSVDRNNNFAPVFNQTITMPDLNVAAFGEDEQGELYVVTYYDGIYKLQAGPGGGTENIPPQLSNTGIFLNTTQSPLADLKPNPGILPYTVNMPLWSDFAEKQRWFAVPGQNKIDFDSTAAWDFPVGSVLVKNFEMTMIENDPNSIKKLETRVMVHQIDGWRGFTYKWREDQTDADLLTSSATETLSIQLSGGGTRLQDYYYPSSDNCSSCHTAGSGSILGLRTAQANRSGTTGNTNQLTSFSQLGYFDSAIAAPNTLGSYPALDNVSASLESRARAYLAANCAHCHQPAVPSSVSLDLRFETPLNQTGTINITPTAGDLGIAGAKIITAGAKENSILWQRINRLDGFRMPPLASHVIHPQAVSVVGQWIDSL